MPRRAPLAVVIALATLAALPAGPARAEPWHAGAAGHRRVTHLAALAAGGALYAISETIAKPALAPDACRWCNGNGFDDRVRESLRWDSPTTAATLSNVSGYVASPVVMLGLTALGAARGEPDDRVGRVLDDVIPVLEGVVYGELVVQAAKFSFGRQRPRVRAAGGGSGQDDNLSFFSGHTTLTVSLAVGAGLAANRRDSDLAPVVWATGVSLTAVTGYLRIAADQHYATDVLTGAAWGVVAAVYIPRLTGALPAGTTLVPQPGGVALAGRF